MHRCVDCGGPVEDFMVEAVKNPKTNEIDLENLVCEACDVYNGTDGQMHEFFAREADYLSDYQDYYDYDEDDFFNEDPLDREYED